MLALRKIFNKLPIFIFIIIIVGNCSIAFANDRDRYIEAREFGELFGYSDGYLEGIKNYSTGLKLSYYQIRPSRNQITKEYEDYLQDQDTRYISYFISAYYTGFEKGYNDGIKGDGDLSTAKDNYASWLGSTLGEIFGYRDFYNNRRANGTNALPSNKNLIEMFNLNGFTSQYRLEFLRKFKEGFLEGYQEGYRRANFEPIRVSYEEGIRDGEYFGHLLGKVNGAKDYFNNMSRDYKRDLPSDKSIEREFSLSKDGKEYRDGFIIGFKRTYEESYNETFRAMNVDMHLRAYELGYLDGKDAGINKGEILATIDFYLKDTNDWRRHLPNQEDIIKEYNLALESNRYREGFIVGYIEGLSQGYMAKFQDLHWEEIRIKSKAEKIPISGGEVKSLDNILILNIDKGTYYAPVIVAIDMIPDPINMADDRYIKASDFYRVEIINQLGEANDEKTLELQFEYYGDYKGGIYKLVDGKWLYIPSIIEEGFIKAKVKPSSFKDGPNIYCVLIDKEAKLLRDTRNHWARDEILAFQRRNIISGYSDNRFRPDKEITKGEFFTIISKVYNWQLPGDKKANIYKRVMDYALNNGIIEKPFKGNEWVTYREVDAIMRKITHSKSFAWSNIASKLLYEKLHRSRSLDSHNNPITRAEAVYMLYILNE